MATMVTAMMLSGTPSSRAMALSFPEAESVVINSSNSAYIDSLSIVFLPKCLGKTLEIYQIRYHL